MNNTDKEIWDNFRDGDSNATSLIYHHNVDFLFLYGKRFTSDESLVLDVIHDLFVYIIQKRDSLGDTEDIRMYLLKAFRRRLFAEIKQQNRNNATCPDSKIEPDFAPTVEERLISKENLSETERELKLGMEKLSAQQREILYYRFNCDLDYSQICEIMSISYDTARQNVSRAIQTLKKYLNNKTLLLLLMLLDEEKIK
ncbi:MAG: RNA polymerase sigma factor [Bacteroidales bacterium]